MSFGRFFSFKSFKRDNHSVAGVKGGSNLGNFIVSTTLGREATILL